MKESNNRQTALQVLVCPVAVIATVGIFLSSGCGGTNEATPSTSKAMIIAEAMYYPDSAGEPVVRLTFQGFPGSPQYQPVQYVVFRNNTGVLAPVDVLSGDLNVEYDNPMSRMFTYDSAPTIASVGNQVCPAVSTQSTTALGISLGTPYVYSAQEIFGEQPGIQSSPCYFETEPITSGTATPLGTANLIFPNPKNVVYVDNGGQFDFSSLIEQQPIVIRYIVQISNSPLFTKNSTFTSTAILSSSTAKISISVAGSNLQRFLPGATPATSVQCWWRVGAQNIADNPGPAVDPTFGIRYIFGTPTSFTLTSQAAPRGRGRR